MKRNSKNSVKKPLGFGLLFLAFSLAFLLVLSLFVGVFRFFSQKSLPASLEPSSCPTVVLDAGHGGIDGGAVGSGGTLEKNVNLSLTLTLYQMLTAAGIPTRLTRSDDVLLTDEDDTNSRKASDLHKRAEIAEETENCLFVSIHMNSFPIAKYSGTQVYFSPNNPESEALAETIRQTVKETVQPENNRAVKKAGNNIYLLDRLSSPAVLVECGFLSNPDEEDLLNQEEYRQKLAFSLFGAILKYIENRS